MTDTIVNVIQKVFGILPQDPFRSYIEELSEEIQGQQWVGVLNYFIPLKEMLEIASVWILAVGTYIVVRTFLKKMTS